MQKVVERRIANMNDGKDSQKYDDIINLPHPTSKKHPRMSLHDRAAQFSPFAALTGHEEAIEETARLTDVQLELDEDTKVLLNEKLQIIRENLQKAKDDPGILVWATITYFLPDERKSGGEYVTVSGSVKKIDEYANVVVMENGIYIPVERISGITRE